jgi:hypothetical protein
VPGLAGEGLDEVEDGDEDVAEARVQSCGCQHGCAGTERVNLLPGQKGLTYYRGRKG